MFSQMCCCGNDDAEQEIKFDEMVYEEFTCGDFQEINQLIINNCKTQRDIKIVEFILNSYIIYNNKRMLKFGKASTIMIGSIKIHKHICYYVDLLILNERCNQCSEVYCEHQLKNEITIVEKIDGVYEMKDIRMIVNKLFLVCKTENDWRIFQNFVYGGKIPIYECMTYHSIFDKNLKVRVNELFQLFPNEKDNSKCENTT